MALEQDNGAIVRRFLERVWNDGDLSAIEDIVDDDFTNFGVRRPGGHVAMRHIVTAWRTAFPGRGRADQPVTMRADARVGRARPLGAPRSHRNRGGSTRGLAEGRALRFGQVVE